MLGRDEFVCGPLPYLSLLQTDGAGLTFFEQIGEMMDRFFSAGQGRPVRSSRDCRHQRAHRPVSSQTRGFLSTRNHLILLG
jgi:hypothetical protein